MSTERNTVDRLCAILEVFMDAWIKPVGEPPRSMHELKTDMDDAYKQGRSILKEMIGE